MYTVLSVQYIWPVGANFSFATKSTKDDGWFSFSMISSVEGKAVAPGEINASYTIQ